MEKLGYEKSPGGMRCVYGGGVVYRSATHAWAWRPVQESKANYPCTVVAYVARTYHMPIALNALSLDEILIPHSKPTAFALIRAPTKENKLKMADGLWSMVRLHGF